MARSDAHSALKRRTNMVAAFVISCVVAGELTAAVETRPNVLLVMTDDQGWGDLSLHGNDILSTPHMDSIARDGASLKWFYVSPVCAPTRASLLTGRFHSRTGVHGVTRGRENMRADEVTLAELFKKAGYATGCYGKWHNGAHYPADPVGQGFDEFVGFCAGHWDQYFDAPLRYDRVGQQSRRFESDGYLVDVITERADAFIRRQHDAEQPWLCYVPYQTPHWPAQMPDKYWNEFKDIDELDVKAKSAYAMVEATDDAFGRLLATVDELGIRENTIVVFLTDNGANSNRFDGGMREQKGSVHEGGSRVPCFIRWPGQIMAGDVMHQLASSCDLLPTLCEWCDVSTEGTRPLDGISLRPWLQAIFRGRRAKIAQQPRNLFAIRGTGKSVAVRSATHRLVRKRSNQPWQLFDISNDPGEKNDIAKQHPEIVEELSAALDEYLAEADVTNLAPAPIEIGHMENLRVELQGHEAFLHGSNGVEGDQAFGEGISYHGPSGFANDWIDNWTSPDAYPFWNVDVVKGGTFQVLLKYRVHPADIGSKVRVTIGDASASTTIEQGILHAKHYIPDKFERPHSFPLDWIELPVGVVDLKPGQTRVEVHADEIAGAEATRLKGVIVRRIGPKQAAALRQ